MDTVHVGESKSGGARCRMFGHKLTSTFVIVRATLHPGGVFSSFEPGTICSRCGRLTCSITVPIKPGDELDRVDVEWEHTR